ncbi:putative quinate permease [Collybia nuda]|uniref:Quinate transporter n=1 Tax=Collybia nuda TaxID=64659 RepID=A0A9P5YC28_9AGAR|nr:putative quinate permease [Collybia nuda]
MLKVAEDRSIPPEVYNWRVYVLAGMAAFGAFMFGYDAGFLGGTLALPSFGDEFFPGGSTGSHPTESANIVTVYQLGALAGSLMAYPITEYLGRTAGIFFAGVMNVVGASMQVATSQSTGLGLFYAGRVIAGLGVGAVSMCVPIYIAEISPTAIRGRLVSFYEVALQVGGLIGFWIPFGVNQGISGSIPKQWRIPVGLQLVPAGILCIGVFFLVESPRWLLKRGRTAQAVENLAWLRHLPTTHPYITTEVAAVRDAISLEAGASHNRGRWSTVKEILLRGNRNRLATGMTLMAFQNLTGINAINYYSPTIFKSLGVNGTSTGLFSTGIYGVVKTVCTLIFCFFVIDRVPRRTILMIGAIGGALSMYYIGAYIAIAKPAEGKNLGGGGISAIAMIYIFAVFYCFSWNGTPWVIASEIYPVTIRGVCMAITAATQWIFQFAISRATPYMVNSFGYGTYLFFGSWMIIMLFWTYFFLRETKGVSLEQMDELFGLKTVYRERDDAESKVEDICVEKTDDVTASEGSIGSKFGLQKNSA